MARRLKLMDCISGLPCLLARSSVMSDQQIRKQDESEFMVFLSPSSFMVVAKGVHWSRVPIVCVFR